MGVYFTHFPRNLRLEFLYTLGVQVHPLHPWLYVYANSQSRETVASCWRSVSADRLRDISRMRSDGVLKLSRGTSPYAGTRAHTDVKSDTT